jgi:hypothetical protein
MPPAESLRFLVLISNNCDLRLFTWADKLYLYEVNLNSWGRYGGNKKIQNQNGGKLQ